MKKIEFFKTALITVVLLVLVNLLNGQIPDETFSSDGITGPLPAGFSKHSKEQQSVALQADGKILIAGYYRFPDNAMAAAAVRLNSNGSVDNTFGTGGIKIINFIEDAWATVILVQPDGKIILAGTTGAVVNEEDNYYSRYDFFVTRLEANSAPDLTFGVKTFHFGIDLNYFSSVACIALQSDGKIIVGGHGGDDYPSGSKGAFLMRLSNVGILDNGFSNDGIIFNTNDFLQTLNHVQFRLMVKLWHSQH